MAVPRAAARRRLPVKEMLLSLASLALVLAALDRILTRVYPAFEISGSMLVADDELGWKLRPSNVMPEKGQTTNRDGFRGAEFARRKSAPLAAFIGDSVTYGATTDDATFPRQFEEMSGWQAYNFGVPNYGPLEYRRVLPHVLRRDPDRVVVGFFVGNDVADCVPERAREFREGRGETNPWAWSGIYRFLLFRRLVTWEPLERALAAAASAEFDARGPRRSEGEFTEMELSRLRVFDAGALRERWACVEDALGAMARDAPGLRLLILPDEMQVNDALWGSLMEKTEHPERFDRGLPRRRLGEIAARLGVPVLDPTDALRAVPERTYFQWDSHPNPLGNRVIAQFLRAKLEAEGR